MSRDSKPTEGPLARPRSRRTFLAQLLAPAVAVAAGAPVVTALAEAATKPAKKSSAKSNATPAPSADPFASARPDVLVARTPEERATLEKQWKGMVDVLEAIRKLELPEGAPPATAFAALARDADASRRKS